MPFPRQAVHGGPSRDRPGRDQTRRDSPGGAVFAMARELCLPIRYIGVGEGAGDIIPFRGEEFVEALAGGDD